MDNLIELATRCEIAKGPDPVLDAAIWLHLPEQEGHSWKHDGDRYAHARQIAGCPFVPKYTSSLDAAMMLIPKGYITFLACQDRHTSRWTWNLRGGFGHKVTAHAESAPLALSAVSLRIMRGLTTPQA